MEPPGFTWLGALSHPGFPFCHSPVSALQALTHYAAPLMCGRPGCLDAGLVRSTVCYYYLGGCSALVAAGLAGRGPCRFSLLRSLASLAMRVAGCPVWVSPPFAYRYTIPCGLCVLRAWSGWPSSPRGVSVRCGCAHAYAAFAPPPLPPGRCGARITRGSGAGRRYRPFPVLRHPVAVVAWHLSLCKVVAGELPLWPASWPALVRRASSGPVALVVLVGFLVAVVRSSILGAVATGVTGRLRRARGGWPRIGLIVPAAGPRRGRGAGIAPRRTRSGARRWGCPCRVPRASVLCCVRCGGLACVDPVTDASGYQYRPSFDRVLR